jgi:GNAT superfamily N-acetyltransferase
LEGKKFVDLLLASFWTITYLDMLPRRLDGNLTRLAAFRSQHSETPQWHKEGTNQPEMHGEVLTLAMDKEALESYSKSSMGGAHGGGSPRGAFHRDAVANSIRSVLVEANRRASAASKFRLRLAQPSDVETVAQLVRALADYVKEPDAVLLTAEDYKHDGFSDDPLYYCLIVDHVGEDNSTTHACGYAISFFGYELGKGRFLYLEDLFLEVDYRQGGGGSLVMSTLALICQSLQCSHLYWQALDWNTAGLKFYDKIGATILDGVKTSRYCGDAMNGFAEDGTG